LHKTNFCASGKQKDANAFGTFTPSPGTGLYHIADEKIADGIKLWLGAPDIHPRQFVDADL
jgi:hypothetical protein